MPTKEIKKEEKQVKKGTAIVNVPKDPLNEYEIYLPVSINGRCFNVMRGASVEVPLEIAKLLKDTGIIDDYFEQ